LGLGATGAVFRDTPSPTVPHFFRCSGLYKYSVVTKTLDFETEPKTGAAGFDAEAEAQNSVYK